MSKGISSKEYDSDMIETVARTIPELKEPVTAAVENARKQKERQTIEEALIEQTAIKMNAEKPQLKSRVHVVR